MASDRDTFVMAQVRQIGVEAQEDHGFFGLRARRRGMGSQIGMVCSLAGYEVIIHDIDEGML